MVNNAADHDLVATLQTNLPERANCNIIHGDIDDDGQCSGPITLVDYIGNPAFNIANGGDAIVVIHINAMAIGDGDIPCLSLMMMMMIFLTTTVSSYMM